MRAVFEAHSSDWRVDTVLPLVVTSPEHLAERIKGLVSLLAVGTWWSVSFVSDDGRGATYGARVGSSKYDFQKSFPAVSVQAVSTRLHGKETGQ